MRVVGMTTSSLDETLEVQQQVAARAQLLAAGLTDSTICRRIRNGDWQRAAPGVYVLAATPLSTEQRRIVAVLYAGDSAQITGLGVLHWYGVRYAPATEKVDLLIPHGTRRRSSGFVTIQRTHDLDRSPRPGGLYWVASAARAVVD